MCHTKEDSLLLTLPSPDSVRRPLFHLTPSFLAWGQSPSTVLDSLLFIHSTILDSFLSTQEVLDETTLIRLGPEARRKGAKLTYFHHASGHFVSVKWEDTGFYN